MTRWSKRRPRPTLSGKTGIPVGILAGVLLAFAPVSVGPAAPQGVSITGSTSGGLQLSKSGSGSFRLGLTGGLRGQVTSSTRAYTASANGALGFTMNGSGDLDVNGTAGATFSTAFKRTRLRAGLTYALQPITFEEVAEDLSLFNAEGTRTRFGLFFAGDHDINALTVAGLELRYSHTDFDPVTADQVPSDDFKLSGNLRHNLNPRTDLTASGTLGWYQSENLIRTESFSADLRAGIDHEISSLTRVNGGFGLSFVNTDETVGTLRKSTWSTALLVDAGVSHDYADGTINLSLSQGVSPNAAGEQQISTGLRGSISYDLNQNTSLGFSAGFSRQEKLGGGSAVETVLSLSPSLSVDLADDLSATASYSLQSGDGTINHRVNVGLSRAFEIRN